jgi:hypothetical protein
LREFLSSVGPPYTSVAVIVDEVHHITNIMAPMNDHSKDPSTAAAYFFYGWSNWNSLNSCFMRMDIACSHGTRGLKMSSGDTHRLRFVGPWPLDVARAALSNSESPAYVAKPGAHDRIIHIAGGVIRRILLCKEFLGSVHGHLTNKTLALMEEASRDIMVDECSSWVQKQLTPDQQRKVALHLVPLLRGKVSWKDLKGAYDYGLVARAESGGNAVPVSPVAASVIHQELSKVWRKGMPESAALSSERGFAFERQMCTLFDPCFINFKTMHLDSTIGESIIVKVDYAKFFNNLKETVSPSLNSVMFVPLVENFRCDAIIIPGHDATGSFADALATPEQEFSSVEASSLQSSQSVEKLEPIQVWEFSVIDPRDSGRVDKVLGWFQAGDLIATLKKLHPTRDITIVLAWPGHMRNSGPVVSPQLVEKADSLGIRILVVDHTELSKCGVALSKPATEL